jgi:CheY-like chemotaxis protein
LGLTLVKKYLELNGATISVDSEKGQGSRFRIHFAAGDGGVAAASPSRRSEQALPADLPIERATLLLVEDDEDTILFVRKILGSGFRLLCASTGEEFREQLRATGGRVDVIVMDLSLRGSEDGLGLTRWLRADERLRNIPVIAVSAHAFERDKENAILAGCDEYLAKPVAPRELLATISEVLRQRPPLPGAFTARG